VDMAAILAEMQAMRAEMNDMRQSGAGAAVGVAHLLVEMLLLVQMMKEEV
jgi:hypothetical protein